MPLRCRGDDKKKQVSLQYHIFPLAHIKLLSNQKRKCCCGDALTDSYYLFEYTPKTNNAKSDRFYAGLGCANKFLRLIKASPLLLFDPLTLFDLGSGNKNHSTTKQPSAIDMMDPLNKELYNAIHLVCIAWDNDPYGLFKDILSFIRQCPNKRTKDWTVTAFNKAITNQGKTLQGILAELRAEYPRLKEYSFPIMEEITKNDKSFNSKK